jgi:hypothetical protein
VVEGHDLVAVEEPDDQRGGRGHRPSQLGEHAVEIVWRQVDQGVPRQDAGDGTVGDGELVHRAELVPAVGVCDSGVVDELGHQVETGRVDLQRAQVCGEVPGPAAHVEHGAGSDR